MPWRRHTSRRGEGDDTGRDISDQLSTWRVRLSHLSAYILSPVKKRNPFLKLSFPHPIDLLVGYVRRIDEEGSMKIDSSLIDNAYANKITKRPPLSERKKEASGSSKTASQSGLDTIELSSGVSIEQIQSFLQTEIGKKIDAMMAGAGIDFSQAAGMDWSPEATSTRIFDMATGLFGIWRDQHPDMTEDELVDSFEKVIRTSVDQGANEAIALIDTAGFDEETKDISQKTISLLHEKLDTHFDDLRGQATGNTA